MGMGGFIKPVYSTDVFLMAFIVALTVGLIGGLYLAYRANLLPPN